MTHVSAAPSQTTTHERETVNIAAHVDAMAARMPDKRAVIVAGASGPDGAPRGCTFADLAQRSDRIASGLRGIGVAPGMRVILMVRPGVDFFALTFALFKVGAVPVLIDPGIGRTAVVRCLSSIDAGAFIGIPLAHVLRLLYRKNFPTLRILVTVGRKLGWGGHTLASVEAARAEPFEPVATYARDPAAILFTSGSTGPPKGVLYTHGIFDAQVRYLNEHYGYTPDEVDLATFPLFALFDAALGMTAVIPDMNPTKPGSADPRKLVDALERFGCTHMFGSPALLRNLARHSEATGAKVPKLRRVITAGAPIAPPLLKSLRGMLADDASVHTPYGATESLPVADITDHEILAETAEQTARGAGTCVGKPLAGMEARIIAINDAPLASLADAEQLAPGNIGEIVVCGPVVTHEYFANPTATAAAKMRDEAGRVWHRMGDVGYRDDSGRLWFCGRKAHRIATASGTLFTVPCEAVFNQEPRVARTALVGVGAPGAEQPVLCVETERGVARSERSEIIAALRELGAAHDHTRGIDTFLFHPSFPVDVRHNAKIFREKLKVWATRQLS